jgi:hypothetical protein
LAASFVLGLLALSLVGKGAEVYKLSRDDRLLTGQITELCSRSFSSPQITRCRAEMLDRLRRHNQTAAGGGAGYLATLAMLADISGDALSIENMNFRDGTLRLDVIAPSAGYLDDINQQLAATGQYQLFIESMDSVPGGSGMKTRMRVVEQ